MAKYQKAFTLGDGTNITVPLSSMSGILEVSQTNGKPVRFSFDLSAAHTYEQGAQGKLIGSPTFTINGLGWKRVNESYYWGEDVEPNPLNYNIPNQGNSGRPSYKICVGSGYYSAWFGTLGIRSYLTGGLNNANKNYLIPSNINGSKGGNDPQAITKGIDGRRYCTILNNDFRAADASSQAPMLFYQDEGSTEWCQYFFPFDPGNDAWGAGTPIQGIRSIWSGALHIFQEDITLSGYDFKRGQCLYIMGIPGNAQWSPNIFGVKPPVGAQSGTQVVFWALANTIDEQPQIGGVVRYLVDNGSGGDPRFFFENGMVRFSTNATNAYPYGYEINQIENFKPNDVSDVTLISGVDFTQKNADGSFLNTECSAAVILNGFRLFPHSTQIVNQNGVWNTLKNNNRIANADKNWVIDKSSIQVIDIGYDSYATAFSSDDPTDPNCKTGEYGSTLMNWGTADTGGIAWYGTKPGVPWRMCSVNDNGKIKFATDGMTNASFTSLPIYVNRNGLTVSAVIDKGGLIVDYDDTSLNEFAWKLSKPLRTTARNDPAAYGSVKGIYYQINAYLMTILIQTDDSHHDILASFYFIQPGTYSISAGYNGSATGYVYEMAYKGAMQQYEIAGGANLAPTDWQTNGVREWSSGSGWQSNDSFGYSTDPDGNEYGAVIVNPQDGSGFSHQNILVFRRDKGKSGWYPYSQPLGTPSGSSKFWIPVYNGSFYIFKQDAFISGRQFYKGEVLWCMTAAGSQRWAVAKDMASTPYAQGNFGGGNYSQGADGRLFLGTGGQICFVHMADAVQSKHPPYNLYACPNLAADGTDALLPYRFGNQPVQNNPRFECPAPFKIVDSVNGQTYAFLAHSIQTKDSKGNQIFENDFISNYSIDFSQCLSDPRQLNLGYANYAAFMGNADQLFPDKKGVMWLGNFSWMTASQIRYCNGLLRTFTLKNGFIDYDVDDMIPVLQPFTKFIQIYAMGKPACRINTSGGGFLTDPNSYGSQMVEATGARNPYMLTPQDMSKVTGIYAQQFGRVYLVVFKCSDNHDVCWSGMLAKGLYTGKETFGIFGE